LNVARVCALGVALVPMPWDCPLCSRLTLHATFAVVLFLCIAYVSLSRAKDTLVLVEDESLKAWYRRWYGILGTLMVASPLTAFLAATLTGSTSRYVFFIETAGIYAFAAYWYFKSRELARTNAELHAVHGDLAATARGVLPVDAARLPT
jgi:ATP/ADP translocase